MRIFLIGFMGCGKTTLGKELAKHLNFNFIDFIKNFLKLNSYNKIKFLRLIILKIS